MRKVYGVFLLMLLIFTCGYGEQCPDIDPPQLVTAMEIWVTTSNDNLAGTDDDVFFRIGLGMEFLLNNAPANDFEQGATDVFYFDSDELSAFELNICDISEISLRKSADGPLGGWLLQGMSFKINDQIEPEYVNENINTWLQNDNLLWTASDWDNGCELE